MNQRYLLDLLKSLTLLNNNPSADLEAPVFGPSEAVFSAIAHTPRVLAPSAMHTTKVEHWVLLIIN